MNRCSILGIFIFIVISSCNRTNYGTVPSAGLEDSLKQMVDTSKPLLTEKNPLLPAISGVNHLGDSIDLQRIDSKYILVEFWASWCPPCRKSNPGYLAIYNKYKGKNFAIFSISLDDKKSKWEESIYQDKLSWKYHLCEFKGWESPLAQKYKVESIPNNILIDQSGKTIAKEVSPEQLEALLTTLIQASGDK